MKFLKGDGFCALRPGIGFVTLRVYKPKEALAVYGRWYIKKQV
ncbi:hypothetical protein ACFL0H_10160 [Thermodesulfobacteriota bacterium]